MVLFGFFSLRYRVLFLSLAFIVTGAWMIAPTWNAGKQIECDLTQLYAGKLPESNWVRVRGRLLWDEAGTEEGRRGGVQAWFVPLVPGGWNENQPVQVIVRINKYDEEKMRSAVTVEGLIQPLGLPFDLQLAFAGEDGPHVGEDVVYIHHGTDPSNQRRFAAVVLALGFAGLIGFVVLTKTRNDDKPSMGYHSLARPRDLNEAVQRTTEEERQHQEREADRENEVDRWMRERGLKKPAAEEDAPAEEREAAAAAR